jgi:uncharacterized protein YlbG (UPF0298 family)
VTPALASTAIKMRLEDYQYLFDNILSTASTRKQLMEFMVKTRNEELLLFYEACSDLLQQSKDKSQLNTQVQSIYDKFIAKQSKYQINISAGIVNKLEQSMNEFLSSNTMDQTDAMNVYKEALNSVLNVIENDTFVRFVRLDAWKKYVKNNYRSRTEMEKIAVHKSQLKQILVTCEDEERPYMTVKDLVIAKSLQRDGIQWDLFHEAKFKGKYVDSLMIFKSNLKIQDEECERKYGKLKTIKAVYTFNCSAIDVLLTQFSEEKNEAIFGSSAVLKFQKPSTVENTSDVVNLTSCLELLNIDFKVPLVSNRYQFNCATVVEVDSLLYCLVKPVPEEYILKEYNDTIGKYVTMRNYIWQIYEDTGEGKCRYTMVLGTTMGGKMDREDSISNWINKISYGKILHGIGKNFEPALSWYIESGRPTLGDRTGKYASLESNIDNGRNLKEILSQSSERFK